LFSQNLSTKQLNETLEQKLTMKIEFDVPENFEIQYYYVLTRNAPVPISWPSGFRYLLLNKPSDAIAVVGALVKQFQLIQTLKILLKLATHNRRLYVIHDSKSIVSWGWCTVGKNNYYRVESNAMTIGPIETIESARGMGLASMGLNAAMNGHIELGFSQFYIDTHQNNIAAQKSFVKAGFGAPCGFYRR
jgi:hypothetical protein